MIEKTEWSSSFSVPHVEKIHDVIAAFFCAYPQGEYTLEQAERFRMVFRRGEWARSSKGMLQPAGASAFSDKPWTHWPMTLTVLIQPVADGFTLTCKHELWLSVELSKARRDFFSEQTNKEAVEFKQYFVKPPDLSKFPPGEIVIQPAEATPAAPAFAPDTANVTAPPLVSHAPQLRQASLAPAIVENRPGQATVRYVSTSKKLSTWWPASAAGSIALAVLLVISLVAPAFVGAGAGGIINVAFWYFVVIGIRYLAVIRPNQH